MNWKTPLSLVVAIALGLVTAKVGWDLVQRYNITGKSATTQKSSEVIVAKADLDPGHQLTAEDLTTQAMPAEIVPEKAFTDTKALIGRTLLAPVITGQTMFEGLLAPTDSMAGIQALVPAGMRAVTVEISDAAGVGGLVAGCYVDVIATLRNGEDNVARTIVENVKVAAVNNQVKAGVPDPNQGRINPSKTVTLVVTPKQAEAIDVASFNSKPRLVLRGQNDKTTYASGGVSARDLVGPLSTPIEIPGAPQSDPTLAEILSKINSMQSTTKPTLTLDPTPVVDPSIRTSVQIIRGGKEDMIYYELSKTPEGNAWLRQGNTKGSDTAPQAPPKVDAPGR